MTATATVRVHPETREALRRLAATHSRTIPEVLREIVQSAVDDGLLSGMGVDFARLATDPEQAATYQAEMAAWDATVVRPETLVELCHRLHLITRPPARGGECVVQKQRR